MTGVEQNAELLKRRIAVVVAKLKVDLEPWIDRHSWPAAVDRTGPREYPPYYAAGSVALLEVAIDRYTAFTVPTDALELVTSCFQRQAARHGRTLQ